MGRQGRRKDDWCRNRILELLSNGEKLTAKQVSERLGVSPSNVRDTWAKHCREKTKIKLEDSKFDIDMCDSCMETSTKITSVSIKRETGISKPVLGLCPECLHGLWLLIGSREEKRGA